MNNHFLPGASSEELVLPVQMLCPLSSTSLAKMYKVHYKTFSKWLQPFAEQIGLKVGRFYNVNQVRIIVRCLGLPAL